MEGFSGFAGDSTLVVGVDAGVEEGALLLGGKGRIVSCFKSNMMFLYKWDDLHLQVMREGHQDRLC